MHEQCRSGSCLSEAILDEEEAVSFEEVHDIPVRGMCACVRVCVRLYMMRITLFCVSTYLKSSKRSATMATIFSIWSCAKEDLPQQDFALTGRSFQIGQNGKYTITLELRIDVLPPKGQQSALVRFAPAEYSLSRRKHRASLYLSEKGCVGSTNFVTSKEEEDSGGGGGKNYGEDGKNGSDEQKGQEKKSDTKGALNAGRWTILSIAVDVEGARMSCYLDGREHSAETDLDKRDLKLGHR